VPAERENADPRLILKATPPKAARTVLPRARLGLGSAELAGKSVIAIGASPGFGKTALLTQWRREAIAAGSAVAWLSLDQWDDTSRFAEGLLLAMRVGTSKPMPDQDFQSVGEYADRFESISRWLARVAAFAGDVLLVLDNVHSLPRATIDSLAYLLHHLPSNLGTVLASRKPLAFPVADLMARGEFASIDADTLRLQPAETTAILHARFGDKIDADTCARLHELTQGWVLGLQLAIATIGRQPSIREAVANSLAHTGDMNHFFVESLLLRLDKSDSDFLVAVSFVDALHPDLCRAITGRDDSASVLQRLGELTPILSEGVDGSWLRIHALAREFLNELFDALPEADRRRHRSSAAAWLAEHHFDEEAARHALRSGQETLAFDLAERSLYEVFLTGQVSRVVQWVDSLLPRQLEHRPRLRIALGWTLAQSDRSAEAAGVIAPILNNPDADIADRFESAQIAAVAALYGDKPDVAQALLAPWREHGAGFNAAQRQVTANFDAFFALHQGAPEQARYLLTQPAGQERDAGRYATGWRDWLFATSYLWQGQVVQAHESLRTALAEVEPIAGRRSPIASMLAATLAAVLWERGEPGEIENLLADRRDVIDQHATPDAVAMSYVVAARAAVHADTTRIAYELLERLFAIGSTRRMPRLCVNSLVEQMRLSALQGRERSAENVADRLRQAVSIGDAAGWGMLQRLVDMHVGVAEAYGRIVRREWDKARVALARARSPAEQLRRNKDLLQIHLLDALAAKNLGQDVDAMFREGLFIVETLGLKRLLADTHPLLVDWDQRVRNEQGKLERPAAPVRGAAHPPRSTPVPETVNVTPSILLTPKERDVVRLLANNLSNKEIASALDLSVQTVKWHLKNLFGKLNAGSRKHLIDRARILGIIDP
jgi:LuxR family maltose regulon positive regulatory protein